MPTDEQLVNEYIAGDEEAFRALVERYVRPVYGFVSRFIPGKGDAEDITQDVFISVWKHIRGFDTEKRFKTWIFTIAKNTALNRLKKKKPKLFSEFTLEEEEKSAIVDSLPDPTSLPEDIFMHKELSRELIEALETLPPMYRLVLLLYYFEDFSLQETAEILKESLNTVKSRHRRGLIILRKYLGGPRDAP